MSSYLNPHDRVRVYIAGPFPPPVHGASLVTERIAERVSQHATVIRLDISPPPDVNGIRRHIARIKAVRRAVANVAVSSKLGESILYVSLAGGLGMAYNLALVISARRYGLRLVFHHHSFSYLSRRSLLMRVVISLGGRKALHIVLCDAMAELLQALYRVREVMTISNAWCVPPSESNLALEHSSESIRLGHLSNLCHSKGLLEVIAVYQELKSRSVDVTLCLAGPIVCSVARQAIAALADDSRTTWLGGLSGPEKEVFYRSIDLFLFPSRYRNEAEPLVVWEAMAAGALVLASNRGCIGTQVQPSGGEVFEYSEFVAMAAKAIEQIVNEPGRLRIAQINARAGAYEAYVEANRMVNRLIESLLWPTK